MKRWFILVLPVLICLITSNAFAAAESDQVIVDGFGWRASAIRKVAMISKPITGYNNTVTFILPANGASFQIKNASDNSVAFSGTLTQFNSGATNAQSGDQVCWADFSAFTTPGTYYLYDPTNNVQSYNFQLNDNIFNNVLTTAGRFFFYQRCGCDITPANGGNWNHDACHGQDLTAHLWNNSADKGAPKDVHGGWHDAGDFNKYVPFTLDAVFALMMAYELNPTAFGDNWNIPESGNGVPDMLDEIKWELDWMLRMQNADGSVCNRVGVLNYVTAYPQDDSQARYYTQATTWATSTFAGLAAHGARLFAAYNTQYPGYSAALSTAAQNAWTYLLANTSMTPASGQDGGGSGGGTGLAAAAGSSTADDDARRRLFAAAEIYKTTGLASAKTYFETNYNAAATADAGNGNQQPITSGYFDPSASWTTNEALVVYASVTTYATTAAVVTAIKNSLKAGIENTVTANYTAKTDPYRAYMFDGHYCWGSNQIKAQWAALTLFGLYLNVNPANAALYKETAEEYLHYFHGRNPLSYIYLTNMGAKGANLTTGKSCMQIYHGWFYAGSPLYDGASSTYGQAPGMLAGGPNQYFDVSTIIPPSGQPPQKSFKDFNIGWDGSKNEDSWEVSEPGIYYQAKYLMVLAYFAGAAGTPTPTQTATNYAGSPTFTPTVTITSTITLTPTLTSTPAVIILNTCDTMLYNGTWSGANAARAINTNASYITQGSGSLQVAITTTNGWNDGIVKCTGFVPTNWSNAASVTLDVYIDPLSAPWLAGSAYHQLAMYVDSAPNKYYRQVSTNQDLTTGWNHITFTINWALDTAAHTTDTDPSPILATDPISSYFFILNSDATNLSTGTMYLDNINLVSLAANTPTFSPTITFTATGSPTYSFTPTFTCTTTPSATPTPTGTRTDTATSSATLTNTMQISFTATYTPTKTMTNTVTQTSTLYAGTPTITETSTACACATYAGNTTIGTYETFNYTQPVLDTNRLTMVQDGVISALEIYVASTSGGNIEMAIYSDSNGSPGSLISASAAQASAAGWNVVNIPPTMVPAGTYWIAWQLSPDVYVTADTGVTGDDQWIAQAFGAFPGTISAPNEFYFVASVKADYCPLTCNTITPTPTPTAIPECMCAAQFGMQYEGSNALGPMNGFASATWYGMSEDGIATSMEVYIYEGSGNARMAIYSNSLTTTAAGTPYELICESQPFAVTVGWNTVAIPQVFLANNTVYWLVFECDDPSIYVAADSGNNGDIYFRTQAFGEYPEEFTNSVSGAFDDSILVNYCPLSCPPTATVTATVSETITETPSMGATKTMTMTPTNVINSPTVTVSVSVTQTYTYTQTFTATATEQVSPSNTPVTPVNTATQSPTQQATATYTTTPQAAATATTTQVAAETATATMTAGVVPIPYPNPAKPGKDDIKMNVIIEKDAAEIKFLLFTPGYRLVREISLGSYPQGMMQVDMDRADFKGMANSVYYFIIEKKYSDGTSAVTKPGKIIFIN